MTRDAHMSRIAYAGVYAAALVSSLDALTTAWFLHFHIAAEGNPIARSWFAAMGVAPALLLRVLLGTLIGLTLYVIVRQAPWGIARAAAFIVLAAAVGWWSFIVVHNVAVMSMA